MRVLTGSERAVLQISADSGDRVTYWTVLANAGDRYAELALQVATDETVAGRGANRYAQERAQQELGRQLTVVEMDRLGRDLVNRDWDLRKAAMVQQPGEGPELRGTQIYDYHTDAFERVALSKYAWTLAPLLSAVEYSPQAVDRVFASVLSVDSASQQITAGLRINVVIGELRGLAAGDQTAREALRADPAFRDFVDHPSFGFKTPDQLNAVRFYSGVVSNPAFQFASSVGDPVYIQLQPGFTSTRAEQIPYERGYSNPVGNLIESTLEQLGNTLGQLGNFSIPAERQPTFLRLLNATPNIDPDSSLEVLNGVFKIEEPMTRSGHLEEAYNLWGSESWSHTASTFDGRNRLDLRQEDRDDGTRLVTDYDAARIQTWLRVETYYDAANRTTHNPAR